MSVLFEAMGGCVLFFIFLILHVSMFSSLSSPFSLFQRLWGDFNFFCSCFCNFIFLFQISSWIGISFLKRGERKKKGGRSIKKKNGKQMANVFIWTYSSSSSSPSSCLGVALSTAHCQHQHRYTCILISFLQV